jgi:hypothetical protein
MRNELDIVLPDLEHVSNVHLGKSIKPLFDYMPLMGIGRATADDAKIREIQLDGLQVDKIMAEYQAEKGLKAPISRHVKDRVGAKDIFYNNNSFAVFDSYMKSVLFDIHAAKAIGATHKFLSSQAARDILGAENVRVLYEKNKKAVRMTRMNVARFNDLTRFFEKYKGLYLTSQIGNVKQFANQTVSMIPANAMINPRGFAVAVKELARWGTLDHPDPDVNSWDDWFHKYGQGIQLRDVLMEKIGSPRSFESTGGRISEKFENITTAPLSLADGLSARIQFLSAYFELGMKAGKTREELIANPDEETILRAELRTDLTQNISDPKFAANMFLGEDNNSRLMHTAFWFLKSFAANMSLNALSSARYAFQSGDKRMAKAFMGQAIIGSLIFSGLSYAWRELYKFIADSITGGEDEDKDAEYVMTEMMTTLAGNLVSDISLAWMPSPVESGAKIIGNEIWNSAWSHQEGTDMQDHSLFYEQDNLRGAAGGYAPMYDFAMDVKSMFTDVISGDFENWDLHDVLYIMSVGLSFAPVIPMRGDAKRGLIELHRSFERDRKAEEARRKPRKRRSGTSYPTGRRKPGE